MPRSPRTISIKLSAGTVQFFADLDAAQGRLRQFGRDGAGNITPISEGFKKLGHEGVTGVQATSGALRVLEGGITNNLRAGERFVANVLGWGPALQAIFPIVGAAAFTGILMKMSDEAYKFFVNMRDAAEKGDGAFRTLNSSIQTTNDGLEATNVKLENEIAKLEGKRQNTLKEALFDARAEADKLGESLEKDINKLYELLEKHKTSGFQRTLDVVFDQAPIQATGTLQMLQREVGGYSGAGGFEERIAGIRERGNQELSDVTKMPTGTKAEQDAAALAKLNAQQKLRNELMAEYKAQLANVDAALKPLLDLQQKQWDEEAAFEKSKKSNPGFLGTSFDAGDKNLEPTSTVDWDKYVEPVKKVRRNIVEQMRGVTDEFQNIDLNAQLKKDQGAKSDARLERPFEKSIREQEAALDGLRAKLAAIGKPEAAQILAEAFAEARKEIEKVNEELKRLSPNLHLTPEQEGKERAEATAHAELKAEEAWQTKFQAGTVSVADRIKSLELLAAAIGKGYEATRSANVETKLLQEYGPRYGDKEWLAKVDPATGVTHQAQMDERRTLLTTEQDTERGKGSEEVVHNLNQQIEMERELARVQKDGAEAVRQVTLAVKLRQMAERPEGVTAPEVEAEINKYNAQRDNVAAADTAKLDEKTAATQRLTAATLISAEAERQAALENRVAEAKREGATPEQVAKIRSEEAATHAGDLAKSSVAGDRVRKLDDEIAKLTEAKTVLGETLAIDIQLRDLENQRLKALAEESLGLRGVRDGVRAFFIEMQEDAKSAAQIVYDALNSSLDRISQNFGKMLTGQKTDWAKALQQEGEQIVQSSVKSLLQTGLGKLGEAFGVDTGGKPDGSAGKPLWVRVVGGESIGSLDRRIAGAVPGPFQGIAPPSPIPGLTYDGGGFERGPGGVQSHPHAPAWLLRWFGHKAPAESTGNEEGDYAAWKARNSRIATPETVPETVPETAEVLPKSLRNFATSIVGSGKPDGSATNPFWVRFLGEVTPRSGAGFDLQPPWMRTPAVPRSASDEEGFPFGKVFGPPASPSGEVPSSPFPRGSGIRGISDPGYNYETLPSGLIQRTLTGSPAAPSAASPYAGFLDQSANSSPFNFEGFLDQSSNPPQQSAGVMKMIQGILGNGALSPSSGASSPSSSGGIGGLLSKLLGLGGDASGGVAGASDALPDVFSTISFPGFAEGSDSIDPGTTAWVGEQGPELVRFGQRSSVVPNHKLGLGGGDTHHHHNYNIDARGADLGVENRLRRLMESGDKASVAKAVQAVHERSKRVPGHK